MTHPLHSSTYLEIFQGTGAPVGGLMTVEKRVIDKENQVEDTANTMRITAINLFSIIASIAIVSYLAHPWLLQWTDAGPGIVWSMTVSLGVYLASITAIDRWRLRGENLKRLIAELESLVRERIDVVETVEDHIFSLENFAPEVRDEAESAIARLAEARNGIRSNMVVMSREVRTSVGTVRLLSTISLVVFGLSLLSYFGGLESVWAVFALVVIGLLALLMTILSLSQAVENVMALFHRQFIVPTTQKHYRTARSHLEDLLSTAEDGDDD